MQPVVTPQLSPKELSILALRALRCSILAVHEFQLVPITPPSHPASREVGWDGQNRKNVGQQ